MKEEQGDLWEHPANAFVITTNGFIRNDGAAVMGRGCAKQAATRWPDLPKVLGALLSSQGNKVFNICISNHRIVTLPVKHHWREKADLQLIEMSTRALVDLVDLQMWGNVRMVRPGCGNGQLDWSDVRPVIEPLLDDRFTVVQK